MIYVALATVVAFVLWRVVGGGFLREVRFILYPLCPYWRSKNQSWWIRLRKLNVGLSAVILFPIGILAWMLHLCFVADRT